MKSHDPEPVSRMLPPEAAQLQRIRTNRVAPARDLSLASVVKEQLGWLRQTERRASGAASAWDELFLSAGVPQQLRERTKVESFRAGVLTVRVSDASSKYALDRFLRSGGETTLARLTPTALKRVKLIL